MTCPVCLADASTLFARVAGHGYWRCGACEATYLDPSHWPTREAERAHYLTHENHPDDPGYRAFLARLATPLLARLRPASSGLDYGCGPGPALAAMLTEAGHRVALYDPFFRNDPTALVGRYDFITCTEVVEHFHRPHAEFQRLDGLLRGEGWLAVMTTFLPDGMDVAAFTHWHYRRDPTHVVFYRPTTFRVIARQRGWSLELPVAQVALMRKTSGGSDPGTGRG